MQNLRAAQAATEELDNLEGNEWCSQMERLQELLNTANAQQDRCNRMVGADWQAGNHPPRRKNGAASRSPSGSGHNQWDPEPAASRNRRPRGTIVASRQDTHNPEVRRWLEERPPFCRERVPLHRRLIIQLSVAG